MADLALTEIQGGHLLFREVLKWHGQIQDVGDIPLTFPPSMSSC